MKLLRFVALALFLSFVLCGCGMADPVPDPTPTPIQSVQPAPTPTPTPKPTPTPSPTPASTPSPTPPPGPTAQEIIDYFVQTALYTEYGSSGTMEPVLLCRRTNPIYYRLIGDFTTEDAAVLQKLTDRLNQINGFPGIYETSDPMQANMDLTFLSQEEMDERTAHSGMGFDGYVTYYWYTDTHEIYHADILYSTDMASMIRPGVLCEELIQSLGLSNDSYTYPDSLFYQGHSEIIWPSELDWTLVELLCHPALQPGMDEQTVRQILPSLLDSVS